MSPTTPQERVLPLSYAQRNVWLASKLLPDSSAYVNAVFFRISGQLHPDTVKSAFLALLNKYESLRTTFAVVDETPMRTVGAPHPAAFKLVDASGWADEQIHAGALAETDLGQDLRVGPLCRCVLFHRTRDENFVLFLRNHIVGDGLSDRILIPELLGLCAFPDRAPPEPPGASYEAFVVAESALLKSEKAAAALEFWKRKLEGDLPVLDLPTAPRPPAKSYRGTSVHLIIDPPLTAALRRVAAASKTTMFRIMISALQSFLHRNTLQPDILLGYPSHGRLGREFERSVGQFANMNVLRTDFSANPTFAAVTAQVNAALREALPHEFYPLTMLAEQIAARREASRTPFFDVTLTALSGLAVGAPQPDQRARETQTPGVVALLTSSLGHLSFEELMLPRCSKYDIETLLYDLGKECVWQLRYCSDLFDAQDMSEFAANLRGFLQSAAERPNDLVSRLSLAPRAGAKAAGIVRAGAARDFSDVARGLGGSPSARDPRAVAIREGARKVTYADLDREASRLRAHLVALGHPLPAPVALVMPPSIELIASIRAVEQLGGTFVLIDPRAAPHRQRAIAERSQATLQVVVARGTELAAGPASVVALAELPPASDNAQARTLGDAVAARQPVCCLFPGDPSDERAGIELSRGALANAAKSMQEVLGLTPADVVFVPSGLGWERRLIDIHMALEAGASVVLGRAAPRGEPQVTGADLAQHGATTLCGPPSMWRTLMEADATLPVELKAVVTGEFISPDLARYLLRSCKSVWSAVGDADCAFVAAVRRVNAATELSVLGEPLSNTTLTVLDGQADCPPVGVAGELFVSGAQVASGLRGTLLPTLVDGVGLATGMVARKRRDGSLELLFRSGARARIDGKTVELAELERSVARLPGVQRCAVVGVRDMDSEPFLHVAWVRDPSAAGAAPEVGAPIAEALGADVPRIEVSELPTLPLAPDGAVLRARLPKPAARVVVAGGATQAAMAPRDAVELRLVQIFERLLRRPVPHIGESFVRLGGTSLVAVWLIAEIKDAFGQDIPLSLAFSDISLGQLAAELRKERPVEDSPLVALQPNGERPPLFLVHPIGGAPFCYTRLSSDLAPQQPVYAFQARGLIADAAPITDIPSMASFYIDSMRAMGARAPWHLGGWSFGGAVAYEMAQQLVAAGESVEYLVMFDTWAPQFRPASQIGDGMDRVTSFARQLLGAGFKEQIAARLRSLPADAPLEQQLELLRTEAVEAGALTEDTTPERLGRIFSVYEGNFKAIRSYVPKPYAGRLSLFVAQEVGLPWRNRDYGDAALGWSRLTTVKVTAAGGNHFTMLAEPHVGTLAAAIRDELGKGGTT